MCDPGKKTPRAKTSCGGGGGVGGGVCVMFTLSEENTVKCLEGYSDIFTNSRTSSLVFGNLRQSPGIVGSLWKSSDEIIQNCRKMAENSLIC